MRVLAQRREYQAAHQEPAETERAAAGKPAAAESAPAAANQQNQQSANSTWAADPEARAALGELMQPLSPFLDYNASN